jgi:hypothetical protein
MTSLPNDHISQSNQNTSKPFSKKIIRKNITAHLSYLAMHPPSIRLADPEIIRTAGFTDNSRQLQRTDVRLDLSD